MTDTVWLGPGLNTHLGGTERLEPVADSHRLGEVVRVSRRSEAGTAELETALSPLLPGAQEWIGRLISVGVRATWTEAEIDELGDRMADVLRTVLS